MENIKISDEVVQEHNRVYDNKWNIISPEGLDLPEGLEYLKNTEHFHNIIISYMSLDDATSALCTFAERYYSITKRI